MAEQELSTMVLSNETDVNATMRISVDLNSICSTTDGANVSACDKSGLGISLSTPIIMMSMGVLGNLLALVVLYTARKEVRKTVFYTLLAGLAWTDLIGQLLVGPIAVIVYANNMEWVGGDSLCTYHAFMMICFGTMTPLLVCSLSLERLLALRFTYFYTRQITRSKAKWLIVGLWLFVLFFCTLPLMGFGSYELQFPGSWCFLNFHRESMSDVGYASVFSILNIVAILIILICNSTVAVTLLHMRKNRKTKHSPSVQRSQETKHNKQKSKLKLETEIQMVWFLCAITVVFSACWLPLNVHILINQVTGQNNIKTDLITIRLASINQILDPWLYILLRKALILKIIKHIRGIITGRKRSSPTRIPNASTNINTDNRMTTNIANLVQECEINVICDKMDEQSMASSSSKESSSSNMHLLPNAQLLKRQSVKRSLSADPQTRDLNERYIATLDSNSESDIFLHNSVESDCLKNAPSFDFQFLKARKRKEFVECGPCGIKPKRMYSLPAFVETSKQENNPSFE